jgi:(1->4)-alpha-D-glucan 1-alpha-D-glucosylmutase
MTPVSTYRIQFNKDFPFANGEAIIPYLNRLGITTLYASPLFKARSGSAHGYDVTDPGQMNPELGGEEGFDGLSGALTQHDMTLLLDIVPNHMAASPENRWWLHVLENGPSSEYSNYFDIVWQTSTSGEPLESKVVLPILGSHYGTILENQELQVVRDGGEFYVAYWDNRLPLDPKTYRVVLEQRYGILRDRLSHYPTAYREYEALIELTEEMPDRLTVDPDLVERRRTGTTRLKAELERLCETYPEINEFIDENLRLINGTQGDPQSFDTLDHLISAQAYRLAFWRVANAEINYRRFFDVADLVSMRIEDEDVFRARHERLIELFGSGRLHGLRIDHIDGLHDPEGYLERLQAFLSPARDELGLGEQESYILIEKILAEHEHLRDEWPTAGTTGYDFLNLVNGLSIDSAATERLTETYQRVSGISQSFEEIAYQQKRRVMAELFSGDVRSLVTWLDRLSAYDRHGRDLTQRELGQALSELTSRFPVYRTYTRTLEVTEDDAAWIEQAIEPAIDARPDLRRAFNFLRRVLTLNFPSSLPDEQKPEWLAFVMRWQQFAGPIMAKGHEDTALYIYHRLSSVNDVGGEPGRIGVPVEEFHARNIAQAHDWPHAMNATSTHDTKRSEDVRARMNVISELADEWDQRVARWQEQNAERKLAVDGNAFPEGNTEYLIYQTLVGAWPLEDQHIPEFRERLKAYLLKATREAKTHTSWINPNDDYEDAVQQFVDAILADGDNPFLTDFREFERTTRWYGALNSLSQVLLKITSPGVPDIYQGNELWDFSLVDPDNRRPIDFDLRSQLLEQLQTAQPDPTDLLTNWTDGRVKLWLTHGALTFRREHPTLFLDGDYLPLEVNGPHADHLVAFARRHEDTWAIVVAPRLYATLAANAGLELGRAPVGDVWQGTTVSLPDDAPAEWKQVIASGCVTADNGTLDIASVLGEFPIALLASPPPS